MSRLLLLALLASGCASTTEGGWRTDGLDASLPDAGDRVVMVKVSASWCEPCQQLAADVFGEGGPGAVLIDRTLPVLVDFDAPDGQALTERYGVIGIPTVLFLRADGTEIDRIADYEGPEAFVREALAILDGGRDSLAEAEQKARANPRDPALLLNLARVKLMRSPRVRTYKDFEPFDMLDAVVSMDPDNDKGLAAQAVMAKGRWLVRVRKDYAMAAKVFHTALRRWPHSKQSDGLRYWTAVAAKRTGDDRIAMGLLREAIAAEPERAGAHALLADFVLLQGGDRAEGRAAALKASELDPKDAYNHYLLASYAILDGDADLAVKEAELAVEIDPKTALFGNILHRARSIR